MSELLELSLTKILQTKTYTAVVFKEKQKKFCIYMDPMFGQIAQELFSNSTPPRPQTFDFISRSFLGLNLSVVRVVLYDIQQSTFFAKILLRQNEEDLIHYIEIDARPSDSLILALKYNAPIFCVPKVVSQTVPYIEEED